MNSPLIWCIILDVVEMRTLFTIETLKGKFNLDDEQSAPNTWLWLVFWQAVTVKSEMQHFPPKLLAFSRKCIFW